ncbi:MAG: pilus assembly protein PilM [Candidatus Paceibacterota bacterium]|jgi:Tfp pilus assembly PilM family ATPase
MYLKRFFEFFPTPRFLKFSYVGIHVEPEVLHFAELLSTGDNFRLGRYGYETFEKGENMLTNESLKAALCKIRDEKGIRYVKAALPEEETYLFTTEVSGVTNREIREEIEFHLEENVPIAGTEALFHYFVVPGEGEKKKAVVSVVSREVVNRYTTLFADCGITAVSFLVESSALSRAVVKQGDEDTQLMVFVSREKTILAIVSHEFVEFTSTSSFGGASFTSAIQKQFDVTPEEARKIKFAQGLLKSGNDKEEYSFPLANAAAVLRDEIQRVSAYWFKLSGGNRGAVQKIVLCGRDSTMPGLADYLSISLKTPVTVSDVWCNMPYYKNNVPPISFRDSVSYGTALGLVVTASL